MAHDDSLEMVNQLRAWVEERLALQAASLNDEEKNETLARYRALTSIVQQLEGLGMSIPEDIELEKLSLEERLHTPDEEESQLVILSQKLSSLAKDINNRLRSMRSRKSSKGKRASLRRLRVKFSDGTIINEAKAIDTFVHSIRHMGLQRVSELPIRKDRRPLVSTQEPESPEVASRLRKTEEGYFINTHSSTKTKADYIQRIAKALRLDISVSIVD